MLRKQMDTREPGCASPQLPPSCSSERAALPCWGTATLFGLLVSETRQGTVPRQWAKFSACEQWAGKARGVGFEAEGEGLASFHRRRMSLDLPLGHSLGKGCPGRSRREARAAQRKAPMEILFPGRVPHCQPHKKPLKAAHSSLFALCPFSPGVAFAASAPAGSIATWAAAGQKHTAAVSFYFSCMHAWVMQPFLCSG